MVEICNTLVTNGLLTVGLAIVVALWCARIQRPAIRHLLWVLVLLRLVVPPIMEVNLASHRDWVQGLLAQRVAVQQTELQFAYRSHLSAIRRVTSQHPGILPTRTLFPSDSDDENVLTSSTAVGPPFDVRGLADRVWSYLVLSLAALWILGSIACLAYQIFVVLRFRQRIREHSYKSIIWQRRADQLANRMGLSAAPEVRLVRETISPMLWGIGVHAQILLPDRLFDQLERRAQDGLICHELAHYQRGDHWVRLLESLAMLVYWWHPVFWWARHEIEKSEELCCDAIAIVQSYAQRRTYAEALLKAIDFVSSASIQPAVSCAVRNGVLRRRLKWIMSKPQGWAGRRKIGPGLFLLFGAILLPFPSIARQLPVVAVPQGSAIAATSTDLLAATPAGLPGTRQMQRPECVLKTDEFQRTILETRSGASIDFGVGRVSVSTWSNSKEQVAIGTTAGSVEVLCTETGATFAEFSVNNSSISCLAFSDDERVLSVADRSGTLSLVQATDGSPLLAIRKPNAHAIQLKFDADGSLRVVWWQYGTLKEEVLRIDGEWGK